MARFYIAARGGVGTPNPPAKINYLQTHASSAQDPTPYLDVILGGKAESPAWLNNPAFRRGWHISIIHAVQSRTETIGAIVRAYASRRPDLWVDTFPAVAKYGQERDTATVATVASGPDRIELSLADRMDDRLFDEPLTLKVRLPDDWTALDAAQKDTPAPASVVEHEGRRYALVDAVPDAGPVVLLRKAAP